VVSLMAVKRLSGGITVFTAGQVPAMVLTYECKVASTSMAGAGFSVLCILASRAKLKFEFNAVGVILASRVKSGMSLDQYGGLWILRS
jgi:hypothetical protein